MATIFTKLLKEAAANAGLPFPERAAHQNSVEAGLGGTEDEGAPTMSAPDLEVGALPASGLNVQAPNRAKEGMPQPPATEIKTLPHPYLAALRTPVNSGLGTRPL